MAQLLDPQVDFLLIGDSLGMWFTGSTARAEGGRRRRSRLRLRRPGFIHKGGLRAKPTRSGVPVEITSPANQRRPVRKLPPPSPARAQNLMRGLAAGVAQAAMAFLILASTAEGQNGEYGAIPPPLLPGIGASDPRIRVDADIMPWRAVGKLQAASMNFRALCTATLISPSTVVTAAHCLFNSRTHRSFPPESLHFLIGYDGSRYVGHAVGVSLKIADGYDPSRPRATIGSDWALVSLDKNLGSPDRVLPMLGEPPEKGADVTLGGYQQDHPFVLMADPQCRIVGRLVDRSGRLLLRHNCTGTNGASGAPLLVETGGRWRLAAIEVAGETGIAGGVAVVPVAPSKGPS
jgi:protease YdgD